MRYDDQDRESSNVEDRRGQGGGGGGFRFPGGGGRGVQIPIPMGRGGGGFSITTLLIIGAIMLLFGLNPLDLLRGGSPGGFSFPDMPQNQRVDRPGGGTNPFDIPGLPGSRDGTPQQPGQPTQRSARPDDQAAQFVRRVLADTEDVWGRVFQSFGRKYEEPRLVMFSGGTNSACGQGVAQMGPFYCPLDKKVYIDLSFFNELDRRFGAPGDFAQAYVVAHEVGHHVQNLLGIASKVQEAAGRLPRGRVGLGQRSAQEAAAAGRRRGGLACRGGDRRRHDPEEDAGPCRARGLHAWIVGAAGALVPSRSRVRPDPRLRHVQHERSLALGLEA